MLEIDINAYEIFRKMYYTNIVKIGNIDYYLNQCPYLDIIFTDRCNARCKFCVASLIHDKEDCNLLVHKEMIKYAIDHLNVKEVLLLGGEPTISKDLLPMIKYLRTLPLDKICMTTNGIRLKSPKYRKEILSSGITHINLSLMSLDPEQQAFISGRGGNVSLRDLSSIWNDTIRYGVKLRINNNVFKGNNNSIEKMIQFYQAVKHKCHSLKFSPLLKTDNFSTVTTVTEFNREHILPDAEYERLWQGIENNFSEIHIIRNKETLGFVEYSMVLLPTPIILNYNHRGSMMQKVTEERKINGVKLLPNGHLSLSWNRELKDFYIV